MCSSLCFRGLPISILTSAQVSSLFSFFKSFCFLSARRGLKFVRHTAYLFPLGSFLSFIIVLVSLQSLLVSLSLPDWHSFHVFSILCGLCVFSIYKRTYVSYMAVLKHRESIVHLKSYNNTHTVASSYKILFPFLCFSFLFHILILS